MPVEATSLPLGHSPSGGSVTGTDAYPHADGEAGRQPPCHLGRVHRRMPRQFKLWIPPVELLFAPSMSYIAAGWGKLL